MRERSKLLGSSKNGERGFARALLILLLLLIAVGAFYYLYERNPSVQGAFRSVKESTGDAATTSRVRAALLLSKRVSPFDIKVETNKGAVSLNGQVSSEEIKSLAGAIAQDTSGVKQIHNELAVNPSAARDPDMERLGDRVADLEIKTGISDAFSKDTQLRDSHIQVEVKNRIVTLSGAVETAAQKHTAEQIAWQAPGVLGVVGNITVTNAPATPESANDKLARRVEFELYSTKAISMKSIQIEADNGTITLSGTVSSRAEKLLSEKITQSVDGVRKVVNNLVAPAGNEP
jgi:osmotically-inducible protein OsmY